MSKDFPKVSQRRRNLASTLHHRNPAALRNSELRLNSNSHPNFWTASQKLQVLDSPAPTIMGASSLQLISLLFIYIADYLFL